MVSIAARQYPWLPVRWVIRNRYENLPRIARYDGPLFQSHGSDDELIPIAAAITLFDAAPTANKKWLEYPNCGHNDPRPMKYYTELSSFLNQFVKPQDPVSNAQGE
jgi:pimeloyl-ACP methyl ester carboxylesterase